MRLSLSKYLQLLSVTSANQEVYVLDQNHEVCVPALGLPVADYDSCDLPVGGYS